jgi:tetratricopeptide (TPR) repeat protein
MPNAITLIIKRTYKILAALIFLVGFFIFYNTYLVDRSAVNLRVALAKVSQAKTAEDFERIKPLLNSVLLKELSSKTVSGEAVSSIEMVQDMVADIRYKQQIDEVKLYLKKLIGEEEKKRGGLLSVLDRINARIYAPTVAESGKGLEKDAAALRARIENTTDPKLLQEACAELGGVYIKKGEIAGVEEALTKAIKIDPKSDIAVKARFDLAFAYKNAKLYDNALAYFEELTERFPANALSANAAFQTADIFYRKKEYRKAVNRYLEFTDKNPKNELARHALFKATHIALYQLKDARLAFDCANRLETGYAGTDLAEHVRKNTKPIIASGLRRQGYKLFNEKKYSPALQSFDKAVGIAPGDGNAYSGRALALWQLDRKDEALASARKAVKLAGADETALTNATFIYSASGNIAEGIQTAEDAMAKIKITRSSLSYNIGCLYLRNKQYNMAQVMFEKAIKVDADFPFAYNNLAYVYWAFARYDEAVVKFSLAASLAPNDIIPRYNLGIAYFYLKRLEESYRQFQAVLELDPENRKAKGYMQRIEGTLKYKPS